MTTTSTIDITSTLDLTTITTTTTANIYTVDITASKTLTDAPTSTYSQTYTYSAPTVIEAYHPVGYFASATDTQDIENICAGYCLNPPHSDCVDFFALYDAGYHWYCGYFSSDAPFNPNYDLYYYSASSDITVFVLDNQGRDV